MAEDYFGIVGTTQGPCRVDAVVAEGGFGVVYRAYHEAFQAPVALKCLKIPVQLDDETQRRFLQDFREEAALLFKLSSSIPSVVRPLHVDKINMSDGRFVPYMAMEWLDGEGLDALIARRAAHGLPPLGIKKAVRLIAPVARALARAHHFPTPDGPISIVHRDLKPDNIFIARLNGEEVVKIFDFGIAKVRSAATQVAGRLSQSGGQGTAFTPGYGAPEQWLPKRFGQTGPWTDVFGLALTTLEAAIGRPIIDGDTAGMMGTACDEQRRPTPRNEGLETTDQVEAVFLAALAVDPRNRYPDAGQFWDALETALGIELSATPTLSGSATRYNEDSVVMARPKSSPGNSSGMRELPPPERQKSIPDIELDLPSLAPAPASRPGSAPSVSRSVPPPKRPAADKPESPPGGSSLRSTTGSLEAPSSTNISLDLDLDVDANRRAAGKPPARSAPVPPSLRRDALASGPFPRTGGDNIPPSRIAPTPPTRSPEPASISITTRLRTPLAVTSVGMFLALVDRIIVAALDNEFHLGPVRLSWVAALLIAIGVVLVMKTLVFPDEER